MRKTILEAIKSYGASRNSLEISYSIVDETSAYIYNKEIEEVLKREFFLSLIKLMNKKITEHQKIMFYLVLKRLVKRLFWIRFSSD